MTMEEQCTHQWFKETDLWSQVTFIPLQGNTNKNYCVTILGRKFHLKVRQSNDFPSFEKLIYVNKLLAIHGVPYAPIIDTVASHPRFPYGAVLFAWQEGETVVDVPQYETRVPDLVEAFESVHRISAPYYENMDLRIRAESYADFSKAVLGARLEQCISKHVVAANIEVRARSFIDAIACGHKVPPVLVHRDATKSNILIRSGEPLMFLDWDNAEFTVPFADLARIIFAYGWNFNDDKQKLILSRYLNTRIDPDAGEILAVEYVRNALEGLIFDAENSDYCRMVLDRLLP